MLLLDSPRNRIPNVIQIANEIGFSNPSHLARHFLATSAMKGEDFGSWGVEPD
jgi:AraC-like DNA-binding protein